MRSSREAVRSLIGELPTFLVTIFGVSASLGGLKLELVTGGGWRLGRPLRPRCPATQLRLPRASGAFGPRDPESGPTTRAWPHRRGVAGARRRRATRGVPLGGAHRDRKPVRQPTPGDLDPPLVS